jgi:class 3 adenylate cyclase
VPRLDTDRRQARFSESAEKPLRQWPGFQPDPLEVVGGVLAAALRMRDSVRDIKKDLLIKIGIHEGPCLAVTLNDRLDYFGQTVNIAARVQSLADSRAIFATKSVVDNPHVSKMLESGKLQPTEQHAALRGVADMMTVYQIP